MANRQMSLVGFMQAGNVTVYSGSWRYPSAELGFLDLDYYQKIARTLEGFQPARDATVVSRLAIELENPGETEAIVADRATRQSWLEARDYKVVHMRVADVERDLEGELVRLDEVLQGAG